MPQRDIEITIGKDGIVRAHIKGIKGKGCMAYAKMLQEIVGKVKSQQLTSEYYEPDEKVRIDVAQKH